MIVHETGYKTEIHPSLDSSGRRFAFFTLRTAEIIAFSGRDSICDTSNSFCWKQPLVNADTVLPRRPSYSSTRRVLGAIMLYHRPLYTSTLTVLTRPPDMASSLLLYHS